MKLTPRLEKIAEYIDTEDKVADIGTDHAYIPVYLVRERGMDGIIASDVNEMPLENARGYVKSSGLEDKIELRLGNGMQVLSEGEADTVIMAGMGGILIAEIMDFDRELRDSMKKYVLQPMVGRKELAEYLEANSYVIEDESLAKEGDKMYQILKVVPKADSEIGTDKEPDITIDDTELKYEMSTALLNSGDPYLEEFLNRKIDKLEKIIESIEKNSSSENSEYLDGLKIKKEKLSGVLKQCFQNR